MQSSVEITLGKTAVIYRKTRLSIRIPLLNSGPVPAKNVIVTSVQLNNERQTTLALPWAMGDISSITHDHAVLAPFSSEGISEGDSCKVELRGTFEAGSQQRDFALSVSILVPALEVRGPQFLASHLTVAVDLQKRVWSYTVWNDEPEKNQQHIAAFQLRLATLVKVKKSPPGWTVMTDSRSFVLWHASESVESRVAPGHSLGGFEIESESNSSEGAVYSLSAWDQSQDRADLIGVGTVLAPARQRV